MFPSSRGLGNLRETFRQMSLQQNRCVSFPQMTKTCWKKHYTYGMLGECDTRIQEQTVNVT